ncbi:18887_t:CDS:2, partial [Gigaspora margarita]
MDKASVISSMNESLLWGTYRPNLYFGTRPQLPESLLTGTMWFGVNDLSSFEWMGGGGYKNYVEKYSYIKHDGRSFAIQNITDEQNNVILKIEFLKTSGGGDWAVRISGIPISEDEPSGLSLLYYFGLEGSGRLDLKNNLDPS